MCLIRDNVNYPDFMTEKHVKAKKTHKCTECYRIIQPGEMYKYVSGKWDGDLKVYKICSHCQVALVLLEKQCGGYIFTDVREDLQEHKKYYDWSRDARRLLAGMRRKWKSFQRDKLLNIPKLVTNGIF